MDLSKFTNRETIRLTENSTELSKLRSYRSIPYVESFIGLGIHRSFFYGVKNGNKVNPLPITQTTFNSTEDIELFVEGPVVLAKAPTNEGSGNITYSGYGIIEVNDSVVYNGNATATPPPAGSISVVTNPASPYDTTDQEVVLVDATSGNKIVNLPPVATSDGYKVVVKKTDASANTVTIEPDGAETIEGEDNAVITQENVSLTLICNGSAWFII
jgi:hypothetical protein